MKKSICLFISLLLFLSFAACGKSESYSEAQTGAVEDAGGSEESSRKDYVTGGGPKEIYGVPNPGSPGGSEELMSDWDLPSLPDEWRYAETEGSEEYDDTDESPFKDVWTSPLSTFSSDVDTASYSNMRRQINMGAKPQGVRIEELVNYFSYDYPAVSKKSGHPFTVSAELGPCPWNNESLLVMVGIQGEELTKTYDIANNIVFLLDVSGSMDADDKLPLLQDSFKLLIDQLDKNDRVSIVTYAGSEKVVAQGVAGNKHGELRRGIDNLYAGGSTAGSRALKKAYEIAGENYIEGGNNRIILATDGDFNVGESSDEAMTKLIEEEREKGIYISVLGFGMRNLKDRKMERIADNGNGNYAYIDTLAEAKKVLVDEFDSTMYTIAQDLKIQVAFNPSTVSQYRLLGYNNRRMENEDFENDAKDAGDIGSGHSVTAFYELVPAGGENISTPPQSSPYIDSKILESDDYMTVRLRYKKPGESQSVLYEHIVGKNAYSEDYSDNFGFASSVVEFGLILTGSEYRGNSSVSSLVKRAQKHIGEDEYGLKEEFISLANSYKKLPD